MMFIQFAILAAAALVFEAQAKCGKIYIQGVTAQGQQDVVNEHNKYRNLIMEGKVPKQPKGVGLKTMAYDDALAKGATAVSNECEMKHIVKDDPTGRFAVGQNLYITWAMTESTTQHWADAVKSWYDEYVDFTYPNITAPKKVTGHYTQVVWGDTNLIGCDFIVYNDASMPDFPYAKLYTCNYGPAGNYGDEVPYKLA